jgi:condensin complex subunit 1
LTAETRQNLLETLCQSVTLLIRILHKATTTVSPACRDAFGFHLYMLYSAMFLLESQVQADAMTNQGAGSNNNASAKVDTTMVEQRATCVETLYTATVAMDESRNNIWQRGVVDEQVVLLPCKMAYLLLERSTGVVARRTFSAVRAMDILTWTVQAHHAGSLLTHVVASVWDLLHSHEHMAALTAEILGRSSSANTTGAHLLAQEMLREYGRLDGSGDPKTTGVKVVAPWVSYLAEERPAWMLPHLSHLVAHLRAEAYQLRSAVVTALAAILVPQQSATEGASSQQLTDEEQVRAEEATPTTTLSSQTREQILLHLETQVHDVSSYTRSAVLKAWSRLVVTHGALPKRWMLRVTQLALERLSDKTVVVRKQAMQVGWVACLCIVSLGSSHSHLLFVCVG